MLPVVCRAQAYPARPVRWVVTYPPGGAADTVARIVGEHIAARLGQPFPVDNKPGAGANIGTELVVKSAPDGYTLLFVTTANAINASLYPNLGFNFSRDIAPVAALVRLPIVLVVHPSVPAATVAEFVAYAKANPGAVNYGSAGIGTSLHLATELFRSMTGTDLTHVPYKGAPQALTDLVGGRLHAMFDNLITSREYIRNGRLRALAAGTAARLEALPDVPTVAETVPGYEASSIFGVGVPAGTPIEIIETLNRHINAALEDSLVRARLADLASVPVRMTHKEFGAELEATRQKWGKLIALHDIRAH